MDNGFNLKEDRITFDCMPEDMQQLHSDMNFCPYCGRKIIDE